MAHHTNRTHCAHPACASPPGDAGAHAANALHLADTHTLAHAAAHAQGSARASPDPSAPLAAGSPQRWQVLWATFLAYWFDSFDLTVLAIVLPVMLQKLSLSLPQGGLLGTATMLGAMLGSVLFGLISENRGRRFALVLALCWMGLGMGAAWFIHDWSAWMVLRFVTGLAIGGVWGPCAALIAEHWAPQQRGRAISFVLSSFAVGSIATALLGRSLLPEHWQWLFVAGAASLLGAPVVHCLLPAEPRKPSSAKASDASATATAASAKMPAALRTHAATAPVIAPATAHAAGHGAASDQAAQSHPHPHPQSQSQSQPGQDPASRVGVGAIFRGGLARVTLPAMLISVVNLAGYWGAAFWIPTFLTKERGLSVQTMLWFSFVMYTGMFFGFQFFGWLADAIGRRRAMLAAFAACAASIAVYIVVRQPVFLFWWGGIVGFALCGAGGILGAYYAELFPAHLRAYAGGFCWNMGRIGAMIAPYTIGVIGKTHGLQAGLALTSGIYLAGALMLFLLPETYRPRTQPLAGDAP